jgi:hypothetical protein
VLPIIDIYRKYYGARVAALLFGLFYLAMAAPGTSLNSCSEHTFWDYKRDRLQRRRGSRIETR